MKVPQPVTGRTRPSSQGISGLQVNSSASAFGADIGPSLSRVGTAVASYAEKVKAQERFDVLRQMSDWSAKLNEELTLEARNSPADDANYFERTSAIIDSRENDFLSKLPAQHQEEFSLRTREQANALKQRQLELGLAKKDAWFETGIKLGREQRKLMLAQSPEKLEEIRALELETIDASGLSEQKKFAQRLEGQAELESLAYKQRLLGEFTDRGGASTLDAVVDRIIGGESAGKTDAKNPRSTASGLGQFLDATFKEYLSEKHPDLLANPDWRKYKTDPVYGRAAVYWYANKNIKTLTKAGIPINETTLYLAHFAGPGGAIAVYAADPAAPVENILGADVIKANPFLAGMSAGAMLDWAAKKMGREALYSGLDDTPGFSHLAYEDRIKLRNSALRDVTTINQAQLKLEEDAKAQRENDFMVQAFDGKVSLADLSQARQEGLFENYGDYARVMGIFDARAKQDADLRAFAQKMGNNNANWSPDDSDDKRIMEAGWVASGGEKELEELDAKALVRLDAYARQTGMVPPKAVNQLNAMTQSADWRRARFALDILSHLNEKANSTFEKYTNAAEKQMVYAYDALKLSYSPEDLQRMLQPPRDGTEVARRKALLAETDEILTKKEYLGDELFDEFKGFLPDFITGLEDNPIPGTVKGVLRSEFNTLFRQTYMQTGDEEASKKTALQMLQQDWGFDHNKRFMKFPPTKYFNKYGDVGLEYLDRHTRDFYGIKPEETYQLVWDSQTGREVRGFREPGTTPSYRIVIYEVGGPVSPEKRISFKPTDELDNMMFAAREARNTLQRLMEAETKLMDAERAAFVSGLPVPQELKDEAAGLRRLYEERLAEGQLPDLPEPPITPPSLGGIANSRRISRFGRNN